MLAPGTYTVTATAGEDQALRSAPTVVDVVAGAPGPDVVLRLEGRRGLRVKVVFGGATEEMSTLVRRDGGCGACHRANGDSAHTVRIYVPGKGPSP